jgi:hypothetical protein
VAGGSQPDAVQVRQHLRLSDRFGMRLEAHRADAYFIPGSLDRVPRCRVAALASGLRMQTAVLPLAAKVVS